ncbi:MAG TPA: sulfite exporter TauE/SafE family protein [Phycisphaerales bacterium]|nr:sulfite exporter TauE/SafE family protein [Phycisphaerales bacterium]HMP37692.1 sulfite exporter TauE/SafE family protein [Phycisphaerales bacterium]
MIETFATAALVPASEAALPLGGFHAALPLGGFHAALPLGGAVLVASLLGSGHCVGMCGAFVAFAVAGDDPRGAIPSRALLNVAYNLGRLTTYTLLGIVAGTLGAAVDLGGSAVGLQRVALAAAGGLMLAFAVVILLRTAGVAVRRIRVPRPLARIVAAGHRAAFALRPLPRAATIGLLTTLLPCGWLYAFAITAAGTASPWLGGVVMAAFWLGTLPALAALGAGIQAVSGPLRRSMPAMTALLLAAVGLWTLLGRMSIPAFAGPAHGSGAHTAHAIAVPSPDDIPLCCRERR